MGEYKYFFYKSLRNHGDKIKGKILFADKFPLPADNKIPLYVFAKNKGGGDCEVGIDHYRREKKGEGLKSRDGKLKEGTLTEKKIIRRKGRENVRKGGKGKI